MGPKGAGPGPTNGAVLQGDLYGERRRRTGKRLGASPPEGGGLFLLKHRTPNFSRKG